jgi:hypothetical protein
MKGIVGIVLICAFCLFAAWPIAALDPAGQEQAEVIDRILAVVEKEVITLTDVRIAEAFKIFPVDEGSEDPPRLQILNRFIDQKIILQMASQQISVPQNELDERIRQTADMLTQAEKTELFRRFGLTWGGLSDYIKESLLFEKAIYNKFSRSVFVSLKEIETYYAEEYVPEREGGGLEVPPMLDILDEIETAIRRRKIASQVREWLVTLRRQANIQIKELTVEGAGREEDPSGPNQRR